MIRTNGNINETEVDPARGDDGRPIVSAAKSPARSSFLTEEAEAAEAAANAECHGVPDTVALARGVDRRIDELIACVADGLHVMGKGFRLQASDFRDSRSSGSGSGGRRRSTGGRRSSWPFLKSVA